MDLNLWLTVRTALQSNHSFSVLKELVTSLQISELISTLENTESEFRDEAITCLDFIDRPDPVLIDCLLRLLENESEEYDSYIARYLSLHDVPMRIYFRLLLERLYCESQPNNISLFSHILSNHMLIQFRKPIHDFEALNERMGKVLTIAKEFSEIHSKQWGLTIIFIALASVLRATLEEGLLDSFPGEVLVTNGLFEVMRGVCYSCNDYFSNSSPEISELYKIYISILMTPFKFPTNWINEFYSQYISKTRSDD